MRIILEPAAVSITESAETMPARCGRCGGRVALYLPDAATAILGAGGSSFREGVLSIACADCEMTWYVKADVQP